MGTGDSLALGLLLAGGGAAAYAVSKATGQGSSDGGASQAQGGQGPGGLPGGIGGLTDQSLLWDPVSGSYIDPLLPSYGDLDNGDPYAPVVNADGLTAMEAAIIDQEATFRQQEIDNQTVADREYQDSIDAANADQKRANQIGNVSNALWAGAAGLYVAPKIVAAGRVAGSAALNAGRSGLGNAASAGRSLLTTSRTAAILRTPAVSYGGAVAAGVGLGLAGTAVLEKTGALDQVAKAGDSIKNNTSQPVQQAIKTAALPASAIGAVATGLVGRGSVRSNLRSAYRGTTYDKIDDKIADGAKSAAKATVQAAAKTEQAAKVATSAVKSTAKVAARRVGRWFR